jgi:hypothetical protein
MVVVRMGVEEVGRGADAMCVRKVFQQLANHVRST